MGINNDVKNKPILNQSTSKKRILVAPLHWGLGHATRCIPIINALLLHNFEPILASDGNALALLKKEFPDLKSIELPSYNISYSKKGSNLKLKLLKHLPHILKTIKNEKKIISEIIRSENIAGIISDNRFGVRHSSIPSVFITHQLTVLSGKTTWLTSKIHQNIISKFTECWVPDYKNNPNLSGVLGHAKNTIQNIKYCGPLSRFEKQKLELNIDILIILSGPEPQRTALQEKLLSELNGYNGTIVLIKGVITEKQIMVKVGAITTYNYMTTHDLEKAINSSKLVISRSGYTTVMDLAKLGKKAFFIPTPGQFEQLYLAEKLSDELIVPYCLQDDFSIEKLNYDSKFSGFEGQNYSTEYTDLFRLF